MNENSSREESVQLKSLELLIEMVLGDKCNSLRVRGKLKRVSESKIWRVN